jgi:hypothetical protein
MLYMPSPESFGLAARRRVAMRDYMIVVGGTGARVLEAVTFLTAAGLVEHPLHVLMIDPDQTNGNGTRSARTADLYHKIQSADQPERPELKFGAFGKLLRRSAAGGLPVFFRTPLNEAERPEDRVRGQLPFVWQNPNAANLRFAEVLNYAELVPDLRTFIDLFFDKDDRDASLREGFHMRPNMGSIALKFHLDSTYNLAGNALNRFITEVRKDLDNGEVKLLVVGSVFGGSGAAALSTLPKFFAALPDASIGQYRTHLRLGAVMLSPYFSFPPPAGQAASALSADAAKQALATQAALMHYAHVPPQYDHVYLCGAPQLATTSSRNVDGGEGQDNSAHYCELTAALAGLDYFSLDVAGGDPAQLLHFADDMRIEAGQPVSQGVQWDTLPASPKRTQFRALFKHRLVSFTTFAYIYSKYLHEAISRGDYPFWAWYRDNYPAGHGSLASESTLLQALRDFSTSYLAWLQSVGNTTAGVPERERSRLFAWQALSEQPPSAGNWLADLSPESSEYGSDGYNQIMRRMDSLRLRVVRGTPVGRLVYLLQNAVEDFCYDNYKWPHK